MLKSISNCETVDLYDPEAKPSLWIVAMSRELRSIELAQNLPTSAEIIFIDLNRSESVDIENNYRAVKEKNTDSSVFRFTSFSEEGKRDQELYQLLHDKINGRCLGIDISSMSRALMASVVACIYRLAASDPINVRLAYSIAKFKKPSSAMSNNAIGPVHSMFGGVIANPKVPRKCMVGLGYEKGKALGALEYLQIDAEYLWIPDSPDPKYLEALQNHNIELLESKARKIYYEVRDPHATLIDAFTFINALKSSSNVVLLPFGPKIFFFICLLTGMEHPQAAVWDVSVADDRSITTPEDEVSAAETIGLQFEVYLEPTKNFKVQD